MFIALGQVPPKPPACSGPFECFADASSALAGCKCQLVIEFSCVHGWLAIWEGSGDRFDLVRESAAGVAMRCGMAAAQGLSG